MKNHSKLNNQKRFYSKAFIEDDDQTEYDIFSLKIN